MVNSDEWIALNSIPVNDLFYTDSWSDVPENGNYIYAVETVYTEGVGAFTFSNTIDIIITGIEDIIANNISVYPNPASEFINITNVLGSDLFLYNVMGKLIYSEHIETDQTRLNVTDLPAGNYILNIITEGNKITKKVSITKQ